MKRKTSNSASRVYAYGVDAPVDNEHVVAEITRQRDFWDRLVDIDRECDRALDDAMKADWPEYAAQVDKLKAQSQVVGELIDERRKERARARRKVDTPTLDERINEAIVEKRAVQRDLWDMAARWRKENRDAVVENEKTRKLLVTHARKASGLYWGNYLRVLDDYDAARKACRKKGRRLRYSDRDPFSGVLHIGHPAFNVGRKSGDPTGLTMDELCSGRCGALRIDPIDPHGAWAPETPRSERARQSRTTVTIRVDKYGNEVTLPMVLHRPIPDGARIKCAQLAWRRNGERVEGRLCLTLSMPRQDLVHASTKACGIDVGWRLERDGALRVATICSSDGSEDFIRLPADWMAGMDQVERLHSHIDDDLLALAEWAQSRDDLPAPVADAVSRWRPGLGARHIDARAIHDYIRPFREDRRQLPRHLTQWYKRYRHLLGWRDHLRLKLHRRRRDAYLVAAKQIAGRHALIGIEDLDLSGITRTKRREDGSDPDLHAAARAQRVRACVHELVAVIRDQASKHGAGVVEVSGPSTMLCHECEKEINPKDRSKLKLECEHCGSVWDRDCNAAANILAAATASARVMDGSENGETSSYGPFQVTPAERSQTGA